jgi:hypothetical protein
MLELPHVLDVKVSFLPVHNFTPQRSITKSPFILPHENNRPLNDEQKWYDLEAAKTNQDLSSTIEERLRLKTMPTEDSSTGEGNIELSEVNQIKQLEYPEKPFQLESPNYDPLPENSTDPNKKSSKRKKKPRGHNKRKGGYPKLRLERTGLVGKGQPKFRFTGAWTGR